MVSSNDVSQKNESWCSNSISSTPSPEILKASLCVFIVGFSMGVSATCLKVLQCMNHPHTELCTIPRRPYAQTGWLSPHSLCREKSIFLERVTVAKSPARPGSQRSTTSRYQVLSDIPMEVFSTEQTRFPFCLFCPRG